MIISLSEQLDSDIKAYIHKVFGTYIASLDERFATDIREDVISASNFNRGDYSDDDISIAFQRVVLGRMGHPDWQIYNSNSEVNAMEQKAKVNTPVHIRPASIEEAGLFYSQMDEAEDAVLGTVGHIRMDFGASGKEFYHTWWPHNGDQFNTGEFKDELQKFVDMLRADGPLTNLASMRNYCYQHGGSFIVAKTGVHPMKVKLRLFLDWGIRFGEPYEVPEKAQRAVAYADKQELEESIIRRHYGTVAEEEPPQDVPAAVGGMNHGMQAEKNSRKTILRP